MKPLRRVVITVMALISYVSAARAQTIPNGNFESWSGETPDGWSVENNSQFHYLASTPTAHGGVLAAHGSVTAQPIITGVGPILKAGSDGTGFPISGGRPGALHGFYKFHSVKGDILNIVVETLAAGTSMGYNQVSFTTDAATFREFILDVDYTSEDIPDHANLTFQFTQSTQGCHPGSTFDLDDLTFGARTTGVADASGALIPAHLELEQNYPNPFTTSTSIYYDLPTPTSVRLTVTDMLGRVVATLIDEHQEAGRYKVPFSAGSLGAGAYVCTLSAGGRTFSRVMAATK